MPPEHIVRVYKFGLLPPLERPPEQVVEGQPTVAELVEKQFRLGHNYQNSLVEVELDIRRQFRARRRALSPELFALERRSDNVEDVGDESGHVIVGLIEGAEKEVVRFKDERPAAKLSGKAIARQNADDLKGAKSFLKELRAEAKAIKKTLKDDGSLKALADELNTVRTDRGKALRKKYSRVEGCYWGTYLISEESHKAACKSGRDPNFKRWTGSAAVGVQLQKSPIDGQVGLAVEHMVGVDEKRIRVEWIEDAATWDPRRRPGPIQRTRPPKRHKWYHLHFRIGSGEKGRPVWATFPMVMHRDWPIGARVKFARVHRRHVAEDQVQWYAVFTLSIPKDCPNLRRPKRASGGRAALDVGWRRVRRTDDGWRVASNENMDDDRYARAAKKDVVADQHSCERKSPYESETLAQMSGAVLSTQHRTNLKPYRCLHCSKWHLFTSRTRKSPMVDRLRVAMLVDDDGKTSEFLIPARVEQRLKYATVVEGHRDDYFNRVRPLIAEFWSEYQGVVPAQLLSLGWSRPVVEGETRLLTIGMWKSKKRLRAFVSAWGEIPRRELAKNDEVYELAEEWRKTDKHREQHAAGARRRAVNGRREYYRLTARAIAAAYGEVVIEKLDLRALVQRPDPGERDGELPQAARWHRFVVAPGEFLEELRQVVGDGIVQLNPANTTKECARCGHLNDYEKPEVLRQECASCGVSYDQDENAAKNLLALSSKS